MLNFKLALVEWLGVMFNPNRLPSSYHEFYQAIGCKHSIFSNTPWGGWKRQG